MSILLQNKFLKFIRPLGLTPSGYFDPGDCIYDMKNFQKINLDNRLFLCAENVRPGKLVADVGTDHAYIPIWLALNGLTPHVLATDVREGPLLNAKKI